MIKIIIVFLASFVVLGLILIMALGGESGEHGVGKNKKGGA